jgi:glycerophosphoryl diester phosphodiesterase
VIPAHPFLDHPGPIAFAHRGGTELQPENTLRAFESAVALGYRYLETDVHATSDGVLVAFHDDTLERLLDLQGMVAETAWADLRAARVGGAEPILRFEALLEALPEARINVEIKHDPAVAPLIRAIRPPGTLERVCVGSFSDARLAEVRRALGPDLCTSLGRIEVAALRAAAWGAGPLGRALARRPGRCVQIPMRGYRLPLVERRLIATAHDLGLPVHVWTINDEGAMADLLDLGVDGLMTDRPSVLRRVLVERGSWPAPESG